ncbi:MAG: type II toxin-antitoxin system Phd/YefM family antitoxin [Methanomassiliicoccaceae archaeon]|nr:type II toxin-antitoxin system Phd/YefM family antitoxin [Methanomassiliicoccaceae archaeon]
MSIINVTQARNDLYSILEKVLGHETVTITSKGGNAVLISEEDWEGIKETLYLMSDPEFLNDVREARNTPRSEYEVWNCRTKS